MLTIGELARRTGVATSALRYYEERGLLPAPTRVAGQRRYPESAVELVGAILLLRDVGFSLAEQKTFIAARAVAPDEWRQLARDKLAQLDEQIAKARTARDALDHALHCPHDYLTECPSFGSVVTARLAGQPMLEAHADKQVLVGGLNEVVRVGDTVRRPRGPWSDRVADLLRHLEKVGFRQAPRFLGAEGDVEVLDFLPGEVHNYPLPPAARTDTALISAAKLLRAYHDATADIASSMPGGWMLPDHEPAEVICHGDFAPYNCVLRDGEFAGVFDFDAAHPGPRSRDIAYALYRFAPMTDPANDDGWGTVEEQAARVRLFCDTYGLTDRAGIAGSVTDRLRDLVEFMRSQAAAGHEGFASHVADGHDLLYLRDIAYIEANAAAFTS